MSKLPTEFVKAPEPKPPAKRSRKASMISPQPVRDPRELTIHLTEDEHRALDEARRKLHAAGTEVTLEQMIHRVFAEWMLRARTIVQEAQAAAQPSAPRDEQLVARLRAFVASPLRMWRELATQVWRTLGAQRG
jgi:hypothetical protein